MADFAQIKADIEQLIKLQSSVEKDFRAIIRDKNIPLSERWELFSKAPEDLKQHDSSLWEPKALGRNWSWYDDWNCERHQTVYVVDFIDNLEWSLTRYADTGEMEYEAFEQFSDTPEIVEVLKEEVLSYALASFKFDW